MAAFDPDAPFSEDRAFALAQNSPVSLYWRPNILDDTISWLAAHGYQVIRLDAVTWTTQADFHSDIKIVLDFPDYYGHNLNALNDCMWDVARCEYGASRDATGTVLVFSSYEAFTAREPSAAQAILDIIATQAHTAMLFGHRLLCLVQSNDPEIQFDAVGAAPVMWNPAETTRANRR